MSRTIGAIALVMVAVMGAEVVRGDEPWERAIAARLRQRVSVAFEDVTLREAVATLRDLGRFNIVLDDAAAREGAEQRIALTLTDIELGNVFALIEQQCSLHHVLRDGVMLLTRDERPEPVVARTYTVSDLLAPVRDFIGPRLGLSRERPYYGCVCFCCPEEPQGAVGPDELVELVRAHVGAAWDKHPDATIGLVRGQLVVAHTPAVQRTVANVLRMLRRDR